MRIQSVIVSARNARSRSLVTEISSVRGRGRYSRELLELAQDLGIHFTSSLPLPVPHGVERLREMRSIAPCAPVSIASFARRSDLEIIDQAGDREAFFVAIEQQQMAMACP